MRRLVSISALLILVAACGEGAASGGQTLRYGFQPGDSAQYDVEIDLDMVMAGTGDWGMPGGIDMTADMHVFATTRYEVAEGPDPDTIRLTTSTELVEGGAVFEMLGVAEELSLDDLAGQMPAMDVEMLVDARGAVIEMLVGGRTVPPGLLESLGGLGGTSALGSIDLSRLFGPELPEQPVAVGSSWATRVSGGAFGVEMETRSEHRVAAVETMAGRETYRIETVTTTGAVEYDLEDLLRMTADDWDDLVGMAGEGVSAAEMRAAMSMLEGMGIEMHYRLDGGVVETTTWFDAAASMVVRTESSGPQHMTMEMTGMPDVGDIAMEIDLTILMAMQLAEG